MKKITKDNKGITLIALIITVILMLILASVTTYTGLNTYKNSKINKFIAEMQLLQAKVDDLVSTKTEELKVLGEDVSTISNGKTIIENAGSNGEISTTDINTNTFRYFSEEKLLNEFDVENIVDGVIINFTTREVISIAGIEYQGKTYYTQYKLPGGQTIINYSSEPSRNLSFSLDILLNGINATVTSKDIEITNGTISYKEENDNYWQTVTNYTENGKTYDAAISKSGNYIFKLQDNTDSENYVEKSLTITLTNKPRTRLTLNSYNYGGDSDAWAYTQIDSVNYVWIPRFAYKTNSETNTTDVKFIKGNSNIATDNTYIDSTWNIHEKFISSDEIELTGIWVSVDAINQKGLDMVTLLNDSNRTTLIEI